MSLQCGLHGEPTQGTQDTVGFQLVFVTEITQESARREPEQAFTGP